MSEDFNEKEEKYEEKNEEFPKSMGLSPQDLEKLKLRGIDPENFKLIQLFPEVLDIEGNDVSLMSAAELEVLATYGRLRKYLIEKYPQSQSYSQPHQELEVWSKVQNAESEEPYDIDVTKAKDDPKSKVFWQTVVRLVAVYDKIYTLQSQASEYEKICLRFYFHLTYNWNHAPDIKIFREDFQDKEIFELVEAYFKICNKYHVPTFEAPYYFLSEEQKRNIKLEGDMLKRTGSYNENEIHISILEGFL